MDPSDPDFDAAYQRMTAAVRILHKDLAAAQDLAQARHVDLSVAAPTRADAELNFGLPARATEGNGNSTPKRHKEA
jgi:hypothetical protein